MSSVSSRDITDLRAAHADSLQALEDANASFYSALAALFTGDTAPMDAVWSHSEEVSLQGPFWRAHGRLGSGCRPTSKRNQP